MELIKWILMIVAILGLLVVGCMMLLRSDEKKRNRTKQYLEGIERIEQTNDMLDETLVELQSYNEPLEKICQQIDQFNHKFLGQK